MGAIELLRDGKLSAALEQLQKEVRSEPANAGFRTFLFQLSAVMGHWDRALAQLAVAGQLDSQALPMVQTYRAALECEALRRAVFKGIKTPLLFGDPQEWIARLLDAMRLDSEGKHDEASRVREGALESAPECSGKIDGIAFEWIGDCDYRLGPICEAIINGKYYWIPFQRLRKIEFDPPADLRDKVWLPAKFTFANGGETVALVPVRYPDSESDSDDLIRLARKTEWRQIAENSYYGLGQRMFGTNQSDYPMLDARLIEFQNDETNLDAPPAPPEQNG